MLTSVLHKPKDVSWLNDLGIIRYYNLGLASNNLSLSIWYLHVSTGRWIPYPSGVILIAMGPRIVSRLVRASTIINRQSVVWLPLILSVWKSELESAYYGDTLHFTDFWADMLGKFIRRIGVERPSNTALKMIQFVILKATLTLDSIIGRVLKLCLICPYSCLWLISSNKALYSNKSNRGCDEIKILWKRRCRLASDDAQVKRFCTLLFA